MTDVPGWFNPHEEPFFKRLMNHLKHDLDSFRQQWREEVTHPPQPPSSHPNLPASPPTHLLRPHQPLSTTGTLTPPVDASALDIYDLAVQAEQSGQLGPAVKLYQRAFRIDDQIDKVYQKKQKELALLDHPTGLAGGTSTGKLKTSNSVEQDSVDSLLFDFKTHFHLGPDYSASPQSITASSSPLYASILAENPVFERADEGERYLWEMLPEEVIVCILTVMVEDGDWRGVSRFEQVCRRAFLVGRQQSIWKRLCALTFRPPQVDLGTRLLALTQPYNSNYRETFLHQPRIRMDGLYISVVHYHRQGITENSWYDEVHTVTYHRLLRFYADGTVISLLSTEHPSTLVPLLNRSLRMKGLHHGTWSLTSFEAEHHKGETHLPGAPRVVLVGLADPGSEADGRRRKYEFEMDLGLRCTQIGRWNKLDLHTYFSNNLVNGESIPISMDVQKPFYFSKVKSWPPFG